MVKHWKILRVRKHIVRVIYLDLTKVFDAIDHKLLMAKPSGDGYHVTLVVAQIRNQFQIANLDNFFSLWEEVETSAPQGSILT